MQELHKLLSRIKWDKEFGKGQFKLGYFDRTEQEIVIVPFRDVYFPKSNKFFFQVTGRYGEISTIPFHRVKEVYKDEKLIWHRKYK